MKFDEYQKEASTTDIHPDDHYILLLAAGLSAEAGEVLSLVYKAYRDGTPAPILQFEAELGDALWYISRIASYLGLSLEEIARSNLHKLHDRQQRGVLGGSGDDR